MSARQVAEHEVQERIGLVDGKALLASAITPAKGSDTLSPFVALAERA